MTMRTDTREATFVGDVAVRLRLVGADGQVGARRATRASRSMSTAEQLYVNDTQKTALFMGKVVAMQGESTLKTPELHVNYEGKAAAER